MTFNWWVSELLQDGRYVELASVVFWVVFSITLHELGHGWAAIRQGDDTPIRLGHMTANPLVHIPPQSLIMFALCGIAWGSMPVNPSRFRNGRRGDVFVSAAGPAMNLLIAIGCVLLVTAWLRFVPSGLPLYRNGAVFLFTGLVLNLALIPFNLLPIPPLDGAHILAGFWRRARRLYDHPEAPIVGLLIFLAIFNMSPVGDILFWQIARGATGAVNTAGAVVGNPGVIEVMYGSEIQDEAAWRLRKELDRYGEPLEGPRSPGAGRDTGPGD